MKCHWPNCKREGRYLEPLNDGFYCYEHLGMNLANMELKEMFVKDLKREAERPPSLIERTIFEDGRRSAEGKP